MPHLPREIMRAVHKKTEQIKYGEEGILHKISLNDERYFVKHWRGKHYRDHRESISYSPETHWKTPVSPFWFKLKHAEADLIHEALPDLVVRMEGGFDPRLSPSGAFTDFKAGRPITITKDVVGDPALRKQRDQIIDEGYQKTFDNLIVDPSGVYRSHKHPYENLLLWAKMDDEVEEQFGRFLDVRKWIQRDTFSKHDDRDRFVARVSKEYAGTDVARLVEAGIAPVHAQVNYIPTIRTGEGQTKGIFLETLIFDTWRLKDALKEAYRKRLPPNQFHESKIQDKIERKLNRYYVLREIDELWDEIYYRQKNKENPLLWKRDVGTAIFQVLDRIRERFYKKEIEFSFDFFHSHQIQTVCIFIARETQKDKLMKHIQAMAEYIEAWKPTEIKAA